MEDVLIYTLEIKSEQDYTNSVEQADRWIQDYSVLVFRDTFSPELENPLDNMAEYRAIREKFKGSTFLEMNTPHAKLIDVPTNDLMLYQQGVFLLLDDFSLMGKSYLTKKIRDEFVVKKWLIDKSICPEILSYISREAPYYVYQNITDLTGVVNEIKKHSKF